MPIGRTGRASFGFVAKYNKKTELPGGNTEFVFQAADLNFHSGSYQWLVIAGPKGQFKGEGTINGAGNYGFMLTAKDDDNSGDTFRIKIWWEEGDAEHLVYDNGFDQPIDGGNIVIHKAK